MIRQALASVLVLGGAAAAAAGVASVVWVGMVAYGYADPAEVVVLAARLRANVELVTGGTLAAVAARVGVPAAVAAAREWLASTVRGTVEDMLGKK